MRKHLGQKLGKDGCMHSLYRGEHLKQRYPQIITGALHGSIRTHSVRRSRSGGKYITIGVKHSEKGAYYANPVEKGHGGPAPAPAHPFVRPAFDVRKDEAYQIMKNVLKDELLK